MGCRVAFSDPRFSPSDCVWYHSHMHTECTCVGHCGVLFGASPPQKRQRGIEVDTWPELSQGPPRGPCSGKKVVKRSWHDA